ncbi:MAG: hypothetical protein LBV12_06680 [Puniceicoccales bacterium]|jgi:hypothetical protein|nr:hypothetical protein [Puniceicoccales bacterium]
MAFDAESFLHGLDTKESRDWLPEMKREYHACYDFLIKEINEEKLNKRQLKNALRILIHLNFWEVGSDQEIIDAMLKTTKHPGKGVRSIAISLMTGFVWFKKEAKGFSIKFSDAQIGLIKEAKNKGLNSVAEKQLRDRWKI